MDYIARIKQLKSEKKMTNDQLSELTGIPLGTLSKILAGFSDSPKLSNIVAICDALGCSLDYIISGTPENHNNYTLDRGEITFIEHYRRLDTHAKELVNLVLNKEYERVTNSIFENESVPASPRGKVLSPRAVADRIGRMERTDIREEFARRTITLYTLPVSAGAGVFLDDADEGEITIPDTVRTRSADYALRISGNSMEPKYRDGDIILVEETESVEPGELAIFVLDGCGYFKKYGGDRLISLNPAYGDIMLKDFDSVICSGRVVGKLKRK